MKIGIVTIHSHFNYGAVLQAFATQMVLKKLGHEPQMIDYYTLDQEKNNKSRIVKVDIKRILYFLVLRLDRKYQIRLRRFSEFRKLLSLSKRYYSKEEIYQNPPVFDVYLVGSDQVWNMEKGIQSYNFLDFIKGPHVRKISYASSFGTSTIPDQNKEELKELLQDFTAISTREDEGVEIIKEATGRDATQVLDPTLLITKSQWQDLLPSEKNAPNNYILIYALNNSEESVMLVEAVRKRYRLPVFGIPMGYKVPGKYKVDREIKDAGPWEFISLLENAKVVCTSSFHGLAFAINFEKTFFVVPHNTRNSRLNSLLKSVGLEERQFFTSDKIKSMPDHELFMDFAKTRNILDNLRQESLSFLKKNIPMSYPGM